MSVEIHPGVARLAALADALESGEDPGVIVTAFVAEPGAARLVASLIVEHPGGAARDLDRCREAMPRKQWLRVDALLRAEAKEIKREEKAQAQAQREEKKLRSIHATVERRDPGPARTWHPNSAILPVLPRDKSEIICSVEIEKTADDAVKALDAAGADLFDQGGRLVFVERGKGISIKGVEREALKVVLSSVARFYQEKSQDGEIVRIPVEPPNELAGYLDTVSPKPFRPIRGILEMPILQLDGSVSLAPGHDAKTGYYHAKSADLELRLLPWEAIDQGAGAAAAQTICTLLSDFPFTDPGDRAGAVALLLSMVARHLIEGCVPLFLVSGNIPGAGKTRLVEVMHMICTGKKLAATSWPKEDEEVRKMLLTYAEAARPLVCIDNIDSGFGSPHLDAALTSGTVSGRRLGSLALVDAESRVLYAATGNNVRITSDLTRRTQPIFLESPLEHPENRTDFTIPDILGHCRANRALYLSAAITVLQAWIKARAAGAKGGAPLGSFEEWSGLIRDAVVYAGLPDPVARQAVMRERADVGSESLQALLVAWRAHYGEQKRLGREVASDFSGERGSGGATWDELRAALMTVARDHGGRGEINATRLGTFLGSKVGQWVGGLCFRMNSAHAGVRRWYVESRT